MALIIQNNAPHTSYVEEAGKYNQYTITLNCEEGYKFSGAVTINYIDEYGFSLSREMAVDDDNKSATYTDYINDTYVVSISAKTIDESEPEPIIVNNIENSSAEGYCEDGVTYITIQSDQIRRGRFYDTECLYTDLEGEDATAELEVTVNDNNTCTAKVTIEDADLSEPIVLNGVFGKVHLINTNIQNATTKEPLPEFIKPKGVLECTVIADDGMEFDAVPTFTWYDSTGMPVSKYFEVDKDNRYAECELDTSLKVYDLADDEMITLNVYTRASEVIGGNYGSINVYKVSEDNLAEFAQKRFFKETATSEGIGVSLIDLGDYVNRIKRLHIEVPVSSKDTLRCGNYDTGITVEAPATDRVTVDFGTVDVPSHNLNNVDYQSEVQLFLPFRGFVSIPSDYVGKEIHLEYVVNVVTGGAVAKVYGGDVCFMVVDVEPSTNIIYRMASADSIALIGRDEWNEQLFYGIEPYILVKWYKSVDADSDRNNDKVRERIGNQLGYIEAVDVTKISNESMYVNEQNDIYDLLQRGVYIE